MVQYMPTRVMPAQQISRGAIILSILSFTLSLVFAFVSLAAMFMSFMQIQDIVGLLSQTPSISQAVQAVQIPHQLGTAMSYIGISLLCFAVSTLFIPFGLLCMAIQLKKYA